MEDDARTGNASETGSDDQMSPEQRTEVQLVYDLQRAAALEEERKTAAQPVDDA
jgi:hypothetical protein